MPRVAALQHVSIETRREDFEACVSFYELVGFKRVALPEMARDRAAWVERDGTQIHLVHTDEPVVPPDGHHALVVDDYERTLGALRDAGFDPEPQTEYWGAPRAFVRNPAGHRVELMAAPPPRQH